MRNASLRTHLVGACLLVPIFTFASGGAIKGRVTYDGAKPPSQMLKISANSAKDCGHHAEKLILSNLLIVSDNGGIKDVVVSLYTKTTKGTPVKGIVSDQKGCMFSSPVIVVPEGSTITFKNSDPGLHNVRASAYKNAALNAAITPGGTKDYTVTKTENITLSCDLHPWMRSYLSVVRSDHYAMTDSEGNFEIRDIPPGEYYFKAWHALLGRAKKEQTTLGTRKLTVEEGKTVEVGVKMKKQ
jgi:plastocyanin